MVNLSTSVITPIKLPNWDHIAQLSKGAYITNIKWTFLKADRDSEYKQHPLGPDFAGITVVTLRNTAASRWRAFFHRVLLFGAVSAVIHYNCIARSLAVLINRALGIPVLNYFDDFGALVPEPLGAMAIWAVGNTSSTIGAPTKTIKSIADTQMAFLGILVPISGPAEMTHIEHQLPKERSRNFFGSPAIASRVVGLHPDT